jgi:hypothetical protein
MGRARRRVHGRGRGEYLCPSGAQRSGAVIVTAHERAHGHAALQQHLGQDAAGAAHHAACGARDQHQAGALPHRTVRQLRGPSCW